MYLTEVDAHLSEVAPAASMMAPATSVRDLTEALWDSVPLRD